MPYNSDYHHRQSTRLRDYDYGRTGAYFVTICVVQKQCLFGEIVDDTVKLGALGQIITACWQAIPDHFPQVVLDAYVVMPNHVHGILVIDAASDGQMHRVGAQHAAPLPQNVKPGSLGAIVRSFKAAASRQVNIQRQTPGELLWQRNYHDRIIRNEPELNRIRAYIAQNPAKWAEDAENPLFTQTPPPA